MLIQVYQRPPGVLTRKEQICDMADIDLGVLILVIALVDLFWRVIVDMTRIVIEILQLRKR